MANGPAAAAPRGLGRVDRPAPLAGQGHRRPAAAAVAAVAAGAAPVAAAAVAAEVAAAAVVAAAAAAAAGGAARGRHVGAAVGPRGLRQAGGRPPRHQTGEGPCVHPRPL